MSGAMEWDLIPSKYIGKTDVDIGIHHIFQCIFIILHLFMHLELHAHTYTYIYIYIDNIIIHIYLIIYTLWLFNIAMENGSFIDDFPIKSSIYEGFSMAMFKKNRVYITYIWVNEIIIHSPESCGHKRGWFPSN